MVTIVLLGIKGLERRNSNYVSENHLCYEPFSQDVKFLELGIFTIYLELFWNKKHAESSFVNPFDFRRKTNLIRNEK